MKVECTVNVTPTEDVLKWHETHYGTAQFRKVTIDTKEAKRRRRDVKNRARSGMRSV